MGSTSDSTRDLLLSLTTGLIDKAAARRTPMRALGGIGIHLRAPQAAPALRRDFADVDLAAPRKARRQVTEVMEEAGLRPEPEFNALQGARRQIWWMPDETTHVDVFLGEFVMCHRLNLDERFGVDHPALPAADLLLMKLQVVELNRKDVTDTAALLATHELGEEDENGFINRHRVVDVLSTDWGFYTTATDNLEKIPRLVADMDAEVGRQVAETAGRIRQEVEEAPKSRGFKLRSRVGRRVRWYELPDESIT
ncbi:MAG: hypothetical protein ACJ76V_13330 [Thermoleophilaceae bacterium]